MAAAAGLRAMWSKAKQWAPSRANQIVKGKNLSVLGGIGCNCTRTLPPSLPLFNPAFRHCFSQSTTDLDPQQQQLTPVPCANDEKGVLFAANYAAGTYNDYRCMGPFIRSFSQLPCFRLLRVVNASAIRIGILSIYSLLLDGITERGDLNLYRALVLHDPLQKLAYMIDCQLINESPFPYTRRFDSVPEFLLSLDDSEGTIDGSMQWEPKIRKRSPSTVASDVIVPVDIEDNEQIHKYALSAVEMHNEYNVERHKKEVNKMFLEKVLRASKLEVDGGFCYLILLRAKDTSDDCSTHCAIIDKHEDTAFFSKPLREYKVSRNIALVYGGGSVGLMGLVAQAVLGVIPRTLMLLIDLITTKLGDTWPQRKSKDIRQVRKHTAILTSVEPFHERLPITTAEQKRTHFQSLGFQNIKRLTRHSHQLLPIMEEAKKKIYACSTTSYDGFQVECSEETAKNFKDVPGVQFVVPDFYVDPVNKRYGGDKYVNGEITTIPYPVVYRTPDGQYVEMDELDEQDEPDNNGSSGDQGN
ncbi:OLC1v1003917C1 [Oldenlandia corymbosa var. corymbosa]|uniref:OLC1v1003917C1 n=1 Tax=Oldenlandia corymbosa var. corymbosa TaxID=529605 RepID=A0AAV1DBQ6_OLDCO|nr:OLC1v1003917C1 [Oldenlandia corymbosa var. corymbosa]